MGKHPAKRYRKCTICKHKLTKSNESLKPGVCINCRFENLRSMKPAPKPKQQRQHVIKPVAVYGEGDEWQLPVDVVGGLDFADPNICPLG